jgi:hypothetical protein
VKRIDTKRYKFPDFDFVRPCRFKFDVEFVEAVEAKACEIVRKFITKERKSILKFLVLTISL